MFLLGHSCWSYIFSKLSGYPVKARLPAYLALLGGILPDFDIYFKPLIQHHTYTHSLIFLGPICAILIIRFRALGAAFSAGVLSHLAADSLVGAIPPLYPISDFQVGIGLGLPSPADTALEVGSLGLVIVWAFLNGDYKVVLKSTRESVNFAIPLVSIVTLTLLFAGDNNVPLTAFAFSRKALTLITIGHLVLIGILVVGSIQGLRFIHKPHVESRNFPPHDEDRSMQSNILP